MMSRLSELATSTDSLYAAGRRSLGLPLLPASEVYMVGDEALCERASRAVDTLFFRVPEGRPVYLARVGPRYVVQPGLDLRFGEFSYLVHLDASFTRRLAVTTF
jgi:hypothetical protein